MSFWDSSAILPLVVAEPLSRAVAPRYDKADVVMIWWATPVECVSGLTRLEREGRLDAHGTQQAIERLSELELTWQEIAPTKAVRDTGKRLLRLHPLRAADALQLAAALAASEGDPSTLEFITLDERLASAARKEGLRVEGRTSLENAHSS